MQGVSKIVLNDSYKASEEINEKLVKEFLQGI